MSGFSVKRGDNGQVQLSIYNVKDYNVDGVAKVTGSATFSLGNTGQSSNETVLQIGATQDTPTVLKIDDDLDNIDFYGSDFEAKFNNKKDKEYNIQWNAVDAKLDSSKDKGSFFINTHKNSSNNNFKLGLADGFETSNYVIDSGSNNTFLSHSKSANYFNTTETSNGANIYAGNGKNLFNIGGTRGFVVGGSGNDLFETSETAKQNILAGMDGNDTFRDFGTENLILGGKGKDTIETDGKGGLANLGFGDDYTAKIGGEASGNAVFAGKEIKSHNKETYNYYDNPNDIVTHNYQDYLNAYLEKTGITMNEFLVKAGLSNNASAAEIIEALKGEL